MGWAATLPTMSTMRSALLQAVIFDVDGTLVDSERDGHRPAFNAAFAQFGLPYRWSVEEYGKLLAVTGGRRRLYTFFREAGHPEEQAEALAVAVHRDKTARFQEACAAGRVPARPGARRLLDELATAGVRVAVATTGSRAWVDPLLDQLFGLARFEVILTGDEVSERKPSPAVYQDALDRLGVPAMCTVAVEDSANGLASALAAGLSCLVVTNDYTQAQDFRGAALVLDSFGRPGTATVRSGPTDAVSDGAVTAATFARLLQG